jgi:hypothetical protein
MSRNRSGYPSTEEQIAALTLQELNARIADMEYRAAKMGFHRH